MYMYIYIHTYIYICIYKYKNIYLCVCVYICFQQGLNQIVKSKHYTLDSKPRKLNSTYWIPRRKRCRNPHGKGYAGKKTSLSHAFPWLQRKGRNVCLITFTLTKRPLSVGLEVFYEQAQDSSGQAGVQIRETWDNSGRCLPWKSAAKSPV